MRRENYFYNRRRINNKIYAASFESREDVYGKSLFIGKFGIDADVYSIDLWKGERETREFRKVVLELYETKKSECYS